MLCPAAFNGVLSYPIKYSIHLIDITFLTDHRMRITYFIYFLNMYIHINPDIKEI